MVAGGWLAVGGAERVVAALSLSDTAVGLTLLALATIAAGALPLLLLTGTPHGKLGRGMGAVLVVAYAAWVTAVLTH
jgi:Ca2+/Na+ antiporter